MLLWMLGCGVGEEVKESGPIGQDSEPYSGIDWPETATWSDVAALRPSNLIIIHIDTLRADRLPFYDSARNTMPLLTARDGWMVQPRHYSASSWTAPSTASIMTSLDLHHHGLIETANLGLAVDWTWGTFLTEQGYRVGLFSGNAMVSPEAGPGLGWTDFTLDERTRGNASALVDGAIDWIGAGTEPFVLFLQPTDPHQEWWPEEEDLGTWSDPETLPFPLDQGRDPQRAAVTAILGTGTDAEREAIKEQVFALYDEELLGLDRAIDRLLTALTEQGLAESTLVVLSADHGETLFDAGDSFGHGWALRQELVRVPLLLYNPTFTNAQFSECVSANVDLFPTLLESMGMTVPTDLDGSSLLSNGCRDHALSSLYHLRSGQLEMYNIATATVNTKVEYDCQDGTIVGYDLSVDPGGIDRLDASTMAEGPALMAVLDAYEVDIRTVYPDFKCKVNR